MADVKAAIDFVLRQEDSTLSGKVTTLKGDSGGATRFGLASASHPELIATGFFDASKVNVLQALVIAENVYNQAYATPLRIAEIGDQALANAVLSFGINSGIGTAAKTLQQAVVRCGKTVDVDGKIGLYTLAVVNAIPGEYLLFTFSQLAKRFYSDLANSHPSDMAFLKGWNRRVQQWGGLAA